MHFILEFTAFFAGYRYYVYVRKRTGDTISSSNRLTLILAAAVGAFIGSRVVGFLENPVLNLANTNLLDLYNLKTIMGGLFGGLLGVELVKWIINERQSSGDLFTLPLIAGIFIGRVGCFLAGTNEFTYGTTTSFITGMDLGDGLKRHPIALYELAFLGALFLFLRRICDKNKLQLGLLFRTFMLAYFGFRFFIEFIKPNVFFFMGLSSIQWLCILCFVYYRRTLITLPIAYKKVHIL